MTETWVLIEDFPEYHVSDYGNIRNHHTGRILRPSLNTTGVVKVGLSHKGKQYSRCLALLVAEAFVEIPPPIGRLCIFDTPIHRDGDQRNCYADNLLWRPRWFAWKYTNQFRERTLTHDYGPIVDLDTNEVYETIFDAAVHNGLLVTSDMNRGVFQSVFSKGVLPTFPTNQRFAFLK